MGEETQTYNCMAIHWVKREEVSVTEPGRGGKESDWTLNLALGVVIPREEKSEKKIKASTGFRAPTLRLGGRERAVTRAKAAYICDSL